MEDGVDMPPGFRFYPTEEELVSFYLKIKLQGRRQDFDRVIPLLDVYDFNPWDLPQYAGELCQGDPEQWFFFIPRQEKEARGGRPCRLTNSGYWKATGSPSCVYSSGNRVIGMKRTMVFYNGRAPSGRKTEWKMNEYKAIDHEEIASSTTSTTTPKLRQEMSLCRVYVKSKCLRAFDRRPSGVVEMISDATVLQARYNDKAMTSNPNRPTSSPDHSSSSGDHATTNPSHSSMEIDNKDVPLWDWEQLNWF